ncbi:hypothetical protein L0F63_000965 [Massospora cicadina]|nr:hypothetical protein L0F63_000965 [Massospora cicadina]
MTHKILNRDDMAPACRPNFQDNPDNYSVKYPRTKTRPGQTKTVQYLENGHVTKDQMPPTFAPNPKTYSFHWTGKPYFGRTDDGSQLLRRGDLGPTNQLGPTLPFDDGACAEDNTKGRAGPLPCHGTYTIPQNTPPGVYQVVWWWKFDRDHLASGEEYTSCFDVEVTHPNGSNSRDNLKIQTSTSNTY